MIELTNAVILNKAAPREGISFTYDKGELISIPFERRYIFDFLALKNQSMDSGIFKIDDTVVFPDEDSEKSIFFLAINSLVKVGLCFLVEKTHKKELIEHVQDELILLRDLPIETEAEKSSKIAAIFGKINELSPAYVLVDFNESCNKNQPSLMSQINKFKTSMLIIGLEVKPVATIHDEEEKASDDDNFEDLYMTQLVIGQETEQTNFMPEKQSSDFLVYARSKKGFGMELWLTFKKNLMVFFSFLIPSVGVIAFLLLSPLYTKTSNKALIIPFVITIVICFSLYMLMTYKCTSYIRLKDKKEKTRRMLLFLTINTIVTTLGAGLGVVIFVLFKNFDTDLKAVNGNTLGIVLAVVFFIILVTACLYLTLVIDRIKSLFKKKK